MRKSARSKKWPASSHVAGRWRFSHISFGVSISGDITPPIWSSTRWPVAVHSSASASARWSSHTIVSQRGSPALTFCFDAIPDGKPVSTFPGIASTETDNCLPSRPRTTSEQVASKLMPAISSADTPALSRAARTAAQTLAQMFSESCSAWPDPDRCMAIGCSARPTIRPARSTMPARALPVPTSTAQTNSAIKGPSCSTGTAGREAAACRRKSGPGRERRSPPAARLRRHGSLR